MGCISERGARAEILALCLKRRLMHFWLERWGLFKGVLYPDWNAWSKDVAIFRRIETMANEPTF